MVSTASLAVTDSEIADLIQKETLRKEHSLELIPSENCVSEAVMEAMGSVVTDKYCEGYPGKRYYGGCENYDQIETLAINRSLQMFKAEGTYGANVQPHSGSSANMAVYFALLSLGDTVLGLRLDHGGHLTHGSPVNFSGGYFKVVSYGVNSETHLIDEDLVFALAREHRPRLIVCGATAYSRQIDFAMFRRAADEVGALLLADVAHYAGLIVGDVYGSPVGYADVITTTTHKTLRGPRGGIILAKKEHMKAINKKVFPGLQGGPIMNLIAAKAVAFKEALQPAFTDYARQMLDNARVLASSLQSNGFSILSGGTDSHLMLIDLRPDKLSGNVVEDVLGKVGITVNKNTVPNDPNSPMVTSGVRLGTPAITSRGMKEAEMIQIAQFIREAVDNRENAPRLQAMREEVRSFCLKFPLYPQRIKK